jgi:adenine-specific DNA-methyltransferase
MAKKKPAASVPVDAHKHVADTRPNIPTRETAAFAADDGPQKFVARRDRSLDPQLVWRGKDEQDAKPLEVPAVPIHVQEKVHPQAIIEAVKGWAKQGKPVYDLFADFNGLDDFSKRLEFYQHDQHWTNRLILGDSLLVMASLAEKERLRGKVQCVYFDPPYGIKFGSNWQVSTRRRDVKDAKADDLTRQPEQIKAFRDTWELGIHSYLSYMRDRLTAARDLLTDSGSIFVQIGDENVHLVRSLLDEVFGSEKAVTTIVVKKKGSQKSGYLDPVNDYILWYSKTSRDETGTGRLAYRPLFQQWALDSETTAEFRFAELPDGRQMAIDDVPVPAGKVRDYRVNPTDLLTDYPGTRLYRANPLTSGGERTNQSLPFSHGGNTFTPPAGSCWKHTAGRLTPDEPCGMERLAYAGRLIAGKGTWRFKSCYSDFGMKPISNWWDNLGGAADPVYVVQTNSELVKRCILMTTNPGDLVLDPTCGSGTTAYVAEQWGRRWITIDTSRVALALARTRLMAARFPYYLLADSPEGRKKQSELTETPPDPNAPAPQRDIHKGFVYRKVAHITSGSIANNHDIKPGMTREQIDKAIAKHAETETLYDQPYEDKDIVRLTGPFTVESLSPHRSLPTAGATPTPVADAPGSPGTTANFGPMILDNLRKAGVKGTDKSQRIAFARLDPFPGEYIQAEGETDTGKAVRVSVGPEFGTLGDADIKKAALEAIRGSKCELLLVCAFAFEPSVHEQTAELTKEIKLGKLAVLPVRMNPDLAMGDELLKKTGAGNLFTVFGEPDITPPVVKDGKVVVTIRGVDVFDPSTGAVRTGGTDDIACWFIDTDYDGQSFFVRHAYFLYGGKDTKDGPYEKLKKALRAEIDEGEWSKLYSATSQPFDPPTSGKIAVKVINHFGDEVLKVYAVAGKAAAPTGKAK